VNAALRAHLARKLAIALMLIAPLGCTVTGAGYIDDGTVGIGVDYYEPFGFDYGGWGPAYGVGPYRDGGHRHDHGGSAPGRAYRPASPSRSIPSIPSHGRPGGGRPAGGAHR
jgi:hypothetical protein